MSAPAEALVGGGKRQLCYRSLLTWRGKTYSAMDNPLPIPLVPPVRRAVFPLRPNRERR